MTSSPFFLTIYLFSFLLTIRATTWTSTTSLQDLESTSDAAFSLEANSWSCPMCPGQKYYNCNGAFVLGGYQGWAGSNVISNGAYFEKTYSALPSHNQVNISMTIYALDSWDSPDLPDDFAVEIDGVRFAGWQLVVYHRTTPLNDYCGSYFTDLPPFTMYIYAPHTANTLTIRIISLLDEPSDNESLGIRDLIINFVEVDTPEQRSCGISNLPLPYNACPCSQTNQYMDPLLTGICHLCDSSCATCDGPTSYNCFSCYSGWYLAGSQCLPCDGNCLTCLGSATYCTSCVPQKALMSNQCIGCDTNCATCLGTTTTCTSCPALKILANNQCLGCDSNCATCEGTVTNCTSCTAPKVLANNQCISCDANCLTCEGTSTNCTSCAPEKIYANNQCYSCDANCLTCQGTTTHCTSCSPGKSFAHNKCYPDCKSPLYSSLDSNSVTWCNTPCPSSVAYWDGSCIPSCTGSNILKDYGAYFVCVPNCLAGSYFSPEGTCIPICNPKYSYPVMRQGIWFCKYRCPAPDYLFLPDGSCVLNCPSGTTNDDPTRSCQPCEDSLCEICPVVTVCTTCVSGAILDLGSSGLCQICREMLTDYDRPIGANSHQYIVNFAPKGCELGLETVKSKLKPTENSKKRLPEFFYNIREVPGKKFYYYITLTFKNSVLKDSELNVKLEYLSGTLEIPKTLVSSTDYSDTSSMAQTALKIAAAVGIGSSAVLSKTGPVWSMINFQQFIGYFIYINIEYPPRVEFLLSLFTFTDWDFLPNPLNPLLEPITDKIQALQKAEVSDKYLPPMKFVRYGVTAFFIENSMGALIANVLVHFFLLLLRMLKGLSAKLNGEKVVNWFYVRMRWTIIFRNFLETAIPIALATFLQVRKVTFETSASAASVFSALLSFVCLAGTLILMLGILEERSPGHLTKKKVRRIHGALYEGIDLNNRLAKYYNILILFRGLVLIFLISFVDIEPIIQICPLIVINVALVIYAAMKTVFEDKYLNWINLIKEIAILIAEIGIVLLYLNFGGEMYNTVLGWTIFCPLAFAATVEIIYVFGGIFLELVKLVKDGYS